MEAKSRKTLVGCLFGCAAVAGVGIVAMIAFVIWLNSAGEPLDPDKLIDDNTRGYASWEISLNDPATARFFETVMDEIDKTQQQPDLPGPLQALLRFNQQRNRDQMARMFPMTAAWTAVSADTDNTEDLHLWTVSLSAAANQIRLVDFGMRLGISEGDRNDIRQQDYRDEQFFVTRDEDTNFVWFIRGGDIYVASGLEPAQKIVDLLIDGRRGETVDGARPSPIVQIDPQDEARLTGLSDPPIRGAIGNDFGLLERLVEWSESGEEWLETARQIRALRIYGGFVNDQDFSFAVYVDCGQPGCEQASLQQRAEEFLAGLQEDQVQAELEFLPYGDGAFVKFELTEITEWFGDWIQDVTDRARNANSDG